MTTLEILLSWSFVVVVLIAGSLAKRLLKVKIENFRMQMECKRATATLKEAGERMNKLQYPPIAAAEWPEYIEEKK